MATKRSRANDKNINNPLNPGDVDPREKAGRITKRDRIERILVCQNQTSETWRKVHTLSETWQKVHTLFRSSSFVIITTDGMRCSQIMRQKSPNVSGSGPWSKWQRHDVKFTVLHRTCIRRSDSSYRLQWKKKCSEETQTLRAGCSKVEPKFFAPPQTPFSGARDGQNLISWRWSLPLPTNQVRWGSLYAISSYHDNRPTHTHTHTQTHHHPPTHKQTGPITIHCAAARAV